MFIVESFVILVYFGIKYCDYAKVNYNMLRDIQRELQKLKVKGADIGKCLTDGINNSFALARTRYAPLVVLIRL